MSTFQRREFFHECLNWPFPRAAQQSSAPSPNRANLRAQNRCSCLTIKDDRLTQDQQVSATCTSRSSGKEKCMAHARFCWLPSAHLCPSRSQDRLASHDLVHCYPLRARPQASDSLGPCDAQHLRNNRMSHLTYNNTGTRRSPHCRRMLTSLPGLKRGEHPGSQQTLLGERNP